MSCFNLDLLENASISCQKHLMINEFHSAVWWISLSLGDKNTFKICNKMFLHCILSWDKCLWGSHLLLIKACSSRWGAGREHGALPASCVGQMQKQTSPYLYRTAGPPSSSRICTPRAGCRSRGHIQDEARIHHRNRPASHSCICCDTKNDYKFKPALSLHFLLPRRKQTSNCDDHGIPNVFTDF